VRDKVVAIMREEINAEPLSVSVPLIAPNQTIGHQVIMTREGNEKGIEKKVVLYIIAGCLFRVPF